MHFLLFSSKLMGAAVKAALNWVLICFSRCPAVTAGHLLKYISNILTSFRHAFLSKVGHKEPLLLGHNCCLCWQTFLQEFARQCTVLACSLCPIWEREKKIKKKEEKKIDNFIQNCVVCSFAVSSTTKKKEDKQKEEGWGGGGGGGGGGQFYSNCTVNDAACLKRK